MIGLDGDEDTRNMWLDLTFALDGTQPCAKDPDKYTENWANRPIPIEVARRACAGCKFLVRCDEYATQANEPYGIWGGRTAEERKRDNE